MRKYSDIFLVDKNSVDQLLKLEIARICGMKTNDISFIAYYSPYYPSNIINPQYIVKLLEDVAGENPYVDFITSEFGILNADNILLFADKIPNKLTIRLICGFSGGDINELRGKVKLELDISDPRTDEYLSKSFCKPNGIKLTENSYICELMTALIEEQLIEPPDLIKLVEAVKSPDIANFLFNYNKNRK